MHGAFKWSAVHDGRSARDAHLGADIVRPGDMVVHDRGVRVLDYPGKHEVQMLASGSRQLPPSRGRGHVSSDGACLTIPAFAKSAGRLLLGSLDCFVCEGFP